MSQNQCHHAIPLVENWSRNMIAMMISRTFYLTYIHLSASTPCRRPGCGWPRYTNHRCGEFLPIPIPIMLLYTPAYHFLSHAGGGCCYTPSNRASTLCALRPADTTWPTAPFAVRWETVDQLFHSVPLIPSTEYMGDDSLPTATVQAGSLMMVETMSVNGCAASNETSMSLHSRTASLTGRHLAGRRNPPSPGVPGRWEPKWTWASARRPNPSATASSIGQP